MENRKFQIGGDDAGIGIIPQDKGKVSTAVKLVGNRNCHLPGQEGTGRLTEAAQLNALVGACPDRSGWAFHGASVGV